MVPFLESFALHLVTNADLRLGPARFAMGSVEVELQQPYRSPVLIRALSPITVYSTLQTADGRKKTYYYAPQEPEWTYPALVDRVTLTDSGFADHLLSNSSGDRYPRAECRRLRL
jgi:hypothetical protein